METACGSDIEESGVKMRSPRGGDIRLSAAQRASALAMAFPNIRASASQEVICKHGKAGQLGGSIRCVVSVSMLTEGWDANVTHVLEKPFLVLLVGLPA